MPHLKTDFQEADLVIPIHVLDCFKSGFHKVLVVSNDTDITVELLYYVPVFKQHGMLELWIEAGRGNTARHVPLHILYPRVGSDLCLVLPALYTLTGCDSTSKIGTKKSALHADAEILLKEFGKSLSVSDSAVQNAEKFLVKVLKNNSVSNNFTNLRREMYHSSNATTHLNLPSTSQGPLPHTQRSYYSTYIITHILTSGTTEAISPLDYGYTLKDGLLTPTTSWKLVDDKWTVTCKCVKCVRVTCPCRLENVKCVKFCGCKASIDCHNPVV